ncbi:MAG: nitroreductase family protein [Clostridiales bacterium]|nr:nitroreductase family protein [Clostridiales bacterium]
MTNVEEIIRNRRSVRKFNDIPLSDEALSAIVEAGRWAPTGGNCQTTHFLVITNGEVLETLRVRVKTAFAGMELAEGQYLSIQNSIRRAKQGDYVYDYHAPALVVVANRRGYPNAMADSACALQNMLLTAEALGVGSCWINQLHWLDENPLVRDYLESLGLGGDETICGAAAFGNYDGIYPRKPRTGMKVEYIR